MYRDCDTYSATTFFWRDKRGEDGECEEGKISEKVMFGKGACETIACVVWQSIVFASDSRIDGSILLSLLHFLWIMKLWVTSNFPAQSSPFFFWFLVPMMGRLHIDFQSSRQQPYHKEMRPYQTIIHNTPWGSTTYLKWMLSIRTLCTSTTVMLFTGFEAWIEREVALSTIHPTPVKINVSPKKRTISKGKAWFSNHHFSGARC